MLSCGFTVITHGSSETVLLLLSWEFRGSDQKILGQNNAPFCRSGNIWLLRFEEILGRVPEFGGLG